MVPMTLISCIGTRAADRPRGAARSGGVHDGVDLGLGDDLGDQRVADVGAHELGPAQPRQFAVRGGTVSMPMTRSIDGSAASWAASAAAEVPADAGDQDDACATT